MIKTGAGRTGAGFGQDTFGNRSAYQAVFESEIEQTASPSLRQQKQQIFDLAMEYVNRSHMKMLARFYIGFVIYLGIPCCIPGIYRGCSNTNKFYDMLHINLPKINCQLNTSERADIGLREFAYVLYKVLLSGDTFFNGVTGVESHKLITAAEKFKRKVINNQLVSEQAWVKKDDPFNKLLDCEPDADCSKGRWIVTLGNDILFEVKEFLVRESQNPLHKDAKEEDLFVGQMPRQNI